MLKVQNLCTGYDNLQVIYNLSLDVNEGEVVSIIGPNGSGKSTILKAICGILPVWKGEIVFNGISIRNQKPAKIIKSGITFSPQGRRIFDKLSVRDNLLLSGFNISKLQLKQRINIVLQLFPFLKKRYKQIAGTLSGGERQILALARALIPSPKLLLLDEPLLGLAPNHISNFLEELKKINKKYKLSMIIVEQKVGKALLISHKVYAIKLGKVAFEGKSIELKNDINKIRQLFL